MLFQYYFFLFFFLKQGFYCFLTHPGVYLIPSSIHKCHFLILSLPLLSSTVLKGTFNDYCMFKHLWSSLICLVTEAAINFYFCERELIILRPNHLFFLKSLEGLGRRRPVEHLCVCMLHAFGFFPEPTGLTVSNLAFSILWELILFQFLSGFVQGYAF